MSGSDESGDERRGGDRIPINEEFSRDASTWVSDLSRGGVFVHSAELLPVGSLIELRFTVLIEDLTVIEAVAKVVRHSRRPQGMGVEFTSTSAEMAARIEAFLVLREPLDSGSPLRLPEPHQHDNLAAERVWLGRPAPVDRRVGEVSFEPVRDDDEEAATAAFPCVSSQSPHPEYVDPATEPTTVFRPPASPSSKGVSADEDERTRQFPVVK